MVGQIRFLLDYPTEDYYYLIINSVHFAQGFSTAGLEKLKAIIGGGLYLVETN